MDQVQVQLLLLHSSDNSLLPFELQIQDADLHQTL